MSLLERQREDILARFERKMAAEREVEQRWFVSGDIDHLPAVVVRDLEACNAFARRALANEPNIKRFRTSFFLSRVKQETRVHPGEG